MYTTIIYISISIYLSIYIYIKRVAPLSHVDPGAQRGKQQVLADQVTE